VDALIAAYSARSLSLLAHSNSIGKYWL